MKEFWENKFQEIQTMWGLESSDSAIQTSLFFKNNHIGDVLIPGVGYGRNAKAFIDNGIQVTGIEISDSAIKLAKDTFNLDFRIYSGSVTRMPFDDNIYDGIYCYALIHLFNKFERKRFIQNCYNQLRSNGYMIFVAVSVKAGMYGKGRRLSKNRFELSKGLNVYFYDLDSAAIEFKNFGLIDVREYDEPIKQLNNEPPLKCILITCKKTE
jgi:SAM-dependent methyltransferase